MAVDEMHTQAVSARGRGRRWLTSLIVIALVGAAAVAIVRVLSLAPLRTTAGPPGWRIFHEPKKDWSVQYPESWHAQRIKEVHKGSPYTASAYGILISNLDRRLEHPELPRGGWSFLFDLTDVPDTFAAVQVMWSYSGGFVMRCDEGTRLPLSLRNATRVSAQVGANPHLEEVSLSFAARHEPLYNVRAWTGPAVSKGDRERIEKIVGSITFANDTVPQGEQPLKCFG